VTECVAVSALGQREPTPHLVCPRFDLGVPGLAAELEGGLPGGFGAAEVAHVVLDTAHQQGQPAGEHQHLPVLGQSQVRVQQAGQVREPLPAFPA
jgi:hypothetical protein